ncbi:MAG: GIY-YIG nuclease family protein [Veillonellales bacterium]
MAYTYIVECADGTYYTGWTTDLDKRLKAHNQGRGARYTRGRGPVRLVYSEVHTDRRQAQSREEIIKQFSRKEKERLIGCEQNLLK